jgi:hypothetical protein
MQRLWNPNQRNVDNLNIARRVASEHFRKKKEYLKAKNYELGTNNKIQNIKLVLGH